MAQDPGASLAHTHTHGCKRKCTRTDTHRHECAYPPPLHDPTNGHLFTAQKDRNTRAHTHTHTTTELPTHKFSQIEIGKRRALPACLCTQTEMFKGRTMWKFESHKIYSHGAAVECRQAGDQHTAFTHTETEEKWMKGSCSHSGVLLK